MIIFIDLKDQVSDEPRFAFFNTIPDQFVDFAEQQTFTSKEDFYDAAWGDSDGGSYYYRCLRRIPESWPQS